MNERITAALQHALTALKSEVMYGGFGKPYLLRHADVVAELEALLAEADEPATLRERLAECQAREVKWLEALKLARQEYLDENDDGYSDCVTPYDFAFYNFQDRSALDAMLAQHARNKLMEANARIQEMGNAAYSEHREQSAALDAACDELHAMAEDELKR